MAYEEMADLVAELAGILEPEGLRLVTAESCTGGWLAKVLTDRAGSSAWFERGLVTYSNAAKVELLGVPESLLESEGAVSRAVVNAMAEGALARSHADLSVAISGVAGPSGGTPDKPVGTVCFAWASRGGARDSVRQRFGGDRETVRAHSVVTALEGLIRLAREDGGTVARA
ncbi:MAG TPA: nicotinamide-nucleotide amidohydrolase family protein [Gammaproteobacteria bacterium]|nr:nicotinamide-nucleotide amidohydrolase family protein [Gammaproteobacteria bacterium]